MKSFEELCNDNYSKIYKYVFLSVNDKSCAEDITQEVFIIAYKKGILFLKHKNPTAFLYKTAKNLVYEEFRYRKKHKNVELVHEIIGNETDIFDIVEKNQDKKINELEYLDYVINKLSGEKKELYTEYYINHKTMKQIAKERKISEVSVRMKFVRIRKEIKLIIKNLKLSEI